MPGEQEHLVQARRNEEFLLLIRELPVRYAEWEVTTLFYSALHYVDAFLATLNEHPRSHRARIDRVRSATSLRDEYRNLYNASMEARYGTIPFPTGQLDWLRTGAFSRVKAGMLSLIGSQSENRGA